MRTSPAPLRVAARARRIRSQAPAATNPSSSTSAPPLPALERRQSDRAQGAAAWDSVPVGLLTVDRRLVVRSANAQGRRLLGVRRQGASIGRRLLDGLRVEDRHRLRDTLSALPSHAADGDGEGVSCGEVRFESGPHGERVWRVEARARPPDGHIVLAFIDVTDSRAETDQAVHRANHDALTGLPNRAAIMEQLRQALPQARSQGHGLAVMFVDLDRFKNLNDTLGHEAGDHLLCEVASRMRKALGARGVAARLGGDEFLVVLPQVATPQQASACAGEIAAAVGQPLLLDDQTWQPTASIGVSVYPAHAADDKSLLRLADLALYRAKREGRNAVRVYDPALDGREGPGADLAAEMARADALLGQAEQRPDRTGQIDRQRAARAAAAYERVADTWGKDAADVRLEARHKQAFALLERAKAEGGADAAASRREARALLAANGVMLRSEPASATSSAARLWISRSLLLLAETCEQTGDRKEAAAACRLILDYNRETKASEHRLPGHALAESKLAALEGAQSNPTAQK